MSRVFTSSRPCNWVNPRSHRDPSLRLHTFGKVQPMSYDDGFFSRVRKMIGRK